MKILLPFALAMAVTTTAVAGNVDRGYFCDTTIGSDYFEVTLRENSDCSGRAIQNIRFCSQAAQVNYCSGPALDHFSIPALKSANAGTPARNAAVITSPLGWLDI